MVRAGSGTDLLVREDLALERRSKAVKTGDWEPCDFFAAVRADLGVC